MSCRVRASARACVRGHIINIYTRVYARETRERHLARTLIQSNQPRTRARARAHSKKPGPLQINHSKRSRLDVPHYAEKNRHGGDQLFCDRAIYFFRNRFPIILIGATHRARDRRFSNSIGIVFSLLNIFFFGARAR